MSLFSRYSILPADDRAILNHCLNRRLLYDQSIGFFETTGRDRRAGRTHRAEFVVAP